LTAAVLLPLATLGAASGAASVLASVASASIFALAFRGMVLLLKSVKLTLRM
jgi:hypothetical protein